MLQSSVKLRVALDGLLSDVISSGSRRAIE